MRSRAVVLAAALAMAPLGAQAADLVVWWDEGYYAEESEAVAEVIAAFEQGSGKQVELVLYPQDELPDKIEAALEAGEPPDFAFGFDLNEHDARWAFEDRLVDISDAIGHFSDLFDPDALASVTWLNARDRPKGAVRAADGPHDQPRPRLEEPSGALRATSSRTSRASGMRSGHSGATKCNRRCAGPRAVTTSGASASPCQARHSTPGSSSIQFLGAYEADYVTPDGHLVIDDPEIRRRLIKAMDSYTAVYRKGCTPPDSLTWGNPGNNEQFLAQAVVMTPNKTLSIPNALKRERPDDYYENTATIEWPLGPSGEPFPIQGTCAAGCGLQGRRQRRHGQGVRPLPGRRGLADALSQLLRRAHVAADAEAARPAVLARPERPAPHGLGDAGQLATAGPHLRCGLRQLAARPGRLAENVWGKAVHRVAADGISPEQAVDEAIARIKQILAE